MNKLIRFHRHHPLVIPLAILLIILCAAYAFIPIRQTFEYNPDEGINLMKSTLLLKGYALYSDIWSDQPPVFTSLLAFWLKIFGASILAARTLVLLFSGLLLFMLYLTVRKLNNETTALLACFFLIFSTCFARMSVSVLIGLPAMALALASLYAALRRDAPRPALRITVSGILLAVSMQTKFFTALLLPLLVLAIKDNRPFRESFSDLRRWLAAFLVTYALIALFFFYRAPAEFISQLFAPHLRPVNAPASNFSIISRMLVQDADLVPLAIAAFLAGRKKAILPAIWLFCSLIILGIHRPIWHHYYLLVSVPLAWLAGIGVTESLKIKNGRWIIVIFSMIAIAHLPFKALRMQKILLGPVTGQKQALVDYLKQRRGEGWILSDSPIYCFYAGTLCPPEAAVISQKMPLTRERAEFILRKYKPRLILLTRKTYSDPEAVRLFEKNYPRMKTQTIEQTILAPETGSYIPLAFAMPYKISRHFSGNARYRRFVSTTYVPVLFPPAYTQTITVRTFEAEKKE